MKVRNNYRTDLHIRFKQTEYDEIKRNAQKRNISMSELVRRAVERYIEKE